jgi:hypothetical protein
MSTNQAATPLTDGERDQLFGLVRTILPLAAHKILPVTTFEQVLAQHGVAVNTRLGDFVILRCDFLGDGTLSVSRLLHAVMGDDPPSQQQQQQQQQRETAGVSTSQRQVQDSTLPAPPPPQPQQQQPSNGGMNEPRNSRPLSSQSNAKSDEASNKAAFIVPGKLRVLFNSFDTGQLGVTQFKEHVFALGIPNSPALEALFRNGAYSMTYKDLVRACSQVELQQQAIVAPTR